jgi:hypothetical protein
MGILYVLVLDFVVDPSLDVIELRCFAPSSIHAYVMRTCVLTSFVLVGQCFHFVNEDMENEMVCPDFCRSCQHIAELRNSIEPVVLSENIRQGR